MRLTPCPSATAARIGLSVVAVALVLGGCGGGDRPAVPSSNATPRAPIPRAVPSMATLPQQFVDVVKRVSPSVVQIQTSDGLGSGVVFDDQGNIVTNAHVVGTATRFQVTASDNKAHSATLVGTYPQSDLAVIHVSDIKPPAATLADSAAIQVGQFALAIGNPLGLRSSVTEGIVSSVGRTVSEGNGVSLSSAIQTSAPINPGISGGALVNLDGQVIGIPTLAATEPQLGGGQAPGIGFAIPSNTVKAIARELIASGRVPSQGRAYLGVTAATVLGGGIVVERVQAGGPAARAGLQPGDVITALAGQDTATTDVLASLLQTLRPGQRVPIQVARQNGSEITLEVTLGSQPG